MTGLRPLGASVILRLILLVDDATFFFSFAVSRRISFDGIGSCDDKKSIVLYVTMKSSSKLLELVFRSTSLEGQMSKKPSISNRLTLREELPKICSRLFYEIGSQQRETTYQNCLAIDLLAAGVEQVHTEVKLPLTYKGHVVSNRRADMVLDLSSGERAIIELKTVVVEMSLSHRAQLEYYMRTMRTLTTASSSTFQTMVSFLLFRTSQNSNSNCWLALITAQDTTLVESSISIAPTEYSGPASGGTD